MFHIKISFSIRFIKLIRHILLLKLSQAFYRNIWLLQKFFRIHTTFFSKFLRQKKVDAIFIPSREGKYTCLIHKKL